MGSSQDEEGQEGREGCYRAAGARPGTLAARWVRRPRTRWFRCAPLLRYLLKQVLTDLVRFAQRVHVVDGVGSAADEEAGAAQSVSTECRALLLPPRWLLLQRRTEQLRRRPRTSTLRPRRPLLPLHRLPRPQPELGQSRSDPRPLRLLRQSRLRRAPRLRGPTSRPLSRPRSRL